MRKKGTATGLALILTLGVCLASKLAYAGQVQYSYRLPSTGIRTTSSTTKTGTGNDAYNYVTAFGKPGRTVLAWIEQENSGTDMTATSSFGNTGTFRMGYLVPGKDLLQKRMDMDIKTAFDTWTEIDVTGNFNTY